MMKAEEEAELLLLSRRNKFLNNTLSDSERGTCTWGDKLTNLTRSFISLHFASMIWQLQKSQESFPPARYRDDFLGESKLFESQRRTVKLFCRRRVVHLRVTHRRTEAQEAQAKRKTRRKETTKGREGKLSAFGSLLSRFSTLFTPTKSSYAGGRAQTLVRLRESEMSRSCPIRELFPQNIFASSSSRLINIIVFTLNQRFASNFRETLA